MASFSEIANKRVAGVPVLYLAGAFVAILAIVAWKMKPSVAPDEATGDEATTPENVPPDSGDPDAADYSGLASNGTVTVVQQTPTTPTEAVKQTNEDWEREAVSYLVDAKLATATDAQSAIRKYLDGANLSFAEGALKDKAIQKLKLPPEPLQTIGTVGTAPAQKQFNYFPGTHIVKGANDNTAAKLATLYYGKSDGTLTIIANNLGLDPAGGGTYNPGVKVNIPVFYAAQYFTVTNSTRYMSQVAAKNGIRRSQVVAYNPGKADPLVVGSKIRVA